VRGTILVERGRGKSGEEGISCEIRRDAEFCLGKDIDLMLKKLGGYYGGKWILMWRRGK